MFSSDPLYTDIDAYNSGNRLFNLNDSQNIWSSDKMYPIDNNFFNKNRSVFNSNLQIADRFNRNNRKPPGNRTETNLIVNYLPDGFYEKELYELFSKAGPIIHYHVENRSECYGFVDYEKSSDAEKAIDMFHQYQIQNKKLKVQNAAEGLQIKEEEKYRVTKGFNNIGYNVEIRNSPTRWTVNDVKNIFGKYGEILKVYEHTNDEISTTDNSTDIRTKTFNVIFRYHTIAMKVVKKKNNQLAEPMWPLELELAIVGQEFIEIPLDNSRSTSTNRPRSAKLRFDQMSDCSWDNKMDSKIDSNYGQRSYENSIFTWGDNIELPRPGLPLSSNGRPILKHKDNLMHLNGSGVYEVGSTIDPGDKWSSDNTSNNNTCNSTTNGLYFDHKIRGSCNDIKAIWEQPKDSLVSDPMPVDIFVPTPLLPSRFRNDDKVNHKANIWFKMENMQPTGSFKLRGMAFWCYKAKLDGVQLVVSSSGGNAGLAAAYACRALKLKCTVVVPHTTPVAIIGELLKENAEVIQEGANWKEAHAKAESIVASYPRVSRLVHPFDSALLWGGYESIVDEILVDMKGARLDMIVLAVGGGGLLNGVAQGITKNKLNKTTAILAMETEGTACFNQSTSVNRIVSMVPNSVATSLGAASISQRSWDLHCSKEFHLFSKTCSDAEAVDACCQFLSEQNCLVEPACGASLSALYNGTLDHMAECRNCDLNVVIVVCGGRCIDVHSLLEMRQVYSSMLPRHSSPYDVSNFDVSDHRFLSSLNINKDSHNSNNNTSNIINNTSNSCYNAPSESELYYGSSSRYDQHLSYNHMFPSITKSGDVVLKQSNILTETTKFGYQRNANAANINNNSNIINSSGGGGSYQHQSSMSTSSILGNSNIDQQQQQMQQQMQLQQQQQMQLQQQQQQQQMQQNSYMSNTNDLMSSPVGSQHSDKENRMLPSDN